MEKQASAVSRGWVKAPCTSEVSDLSERPKTVEVISHEPPAALEHLLDAVTALLDTGEGGRAKTLAHAWRASRQ